MLSDTVLEELASLGEMHLTFEDALLSLDLEHLSGKELDLAKKHYKKGQIAAEVIIRKQLLDKAKKGQIGAARELSIRSLQPKEKKKNTPQVKVTQPHVLDGLYKHQKEWIGDKNRNRMVVASRQTGKTSTISRESFFDALETARNKIFLSASKRQAGLFRSYIKELSYREFGIKLQGTDTVTLHTPQGIAELHFVSPSTIFSHGFSGDLIIDEVGWMRNFEEVKKVIRPIASQKRFRTTFLTTASSMGHGAYAVWDGQDKDGNKKPRDKQGNILRSDGRILLSKHQTTIKDAIASGYDLFDLEDLEEEYTPEEFRQMFMCEWIDERLTFFKLAELEACQLPEEEASRMLSGKHPVQQGYDPSRVRDSASFTSVEFVPDLKQYRRFFGERYHNLPARHQAKKIKKNMLNQKTAEFFGIDTSGFGISVYDELNIIKYPQRIKMKPFYYTHTLKEQLILNTKRLVEQGKFKYSETDTRLTTAFLSIKRAPTHSGDNVTFVANRTADSGHADDFFSTAHALWPAMTEHKRKSNRRGITVNSNKIILN